jgi:uncharacterized protein
MENIDKLRIRHSPAGAVIAVKAVPGSSRDKIAGILGDALKIAAAAPPEKGKANQAVAQILARALGVDKRSVQLVSGPANPHKEFCIAGLSPDELRARLAKL